YERDEFGNIIVTSTSAIGETPRVTRSAYDALGRFVVQSTNELGHTTDTVASPTTGLPLEMTDSNGLTTQLRYDGFRRLVEQINPDIISAKTQLVSPEELHSLYPNIDFVGDLPVAFASISRVDKLPATISLFDNKSRLLRSISDGFTTERD